MSTPLIFSFFSGSGFLDLGFETTGYHIAYVNEIFPPFMSAYRYSREKLNLPQPEYGYHQGEAADVSKLIVGTPAQGLNELVKDSRKLNNIIGFIGGPPCPDFSIGGKNKGHLGDNGKLSSAYVELICQNLPDFFLFENVKGLWRTTKHRLFFEELKIKLQKFGYILTERLINSIEYGVPQDRDRIILIGFQAKFLKDIKIKDEFTFPWEKHILYPQEQVFTYAWHQSQPFQEDSIIPCPENIPEKLTVEYWFRKNHVLNHPNAQHHFQPRAGKIKFATIPEGDDSKKSFKRLHRWRYSPTACYGNNEVHLHPYKIRRISIAEALAIQSLPEDFSLPENMSLTNMFKTVGNGVPYLAAKALAQTILDFLNTGS
ncbi:DNA cytosine methyltransferase [Dolichospermum sp. LEGE 00240]|jgi:DNA (cytosine-5)-methyltransferase 1|uniref:DNA cytosine methyltransferase n=1 Tax=Dolichospermum sp. LEGE 00240 TaxID=1828603 RepID=UPI00187E316A|nr:DNA cytosine methyltransferase [Dolichospermum sp. LEGE 00240]MDM3844916.1 DNA cytosine methyltransferase [Aphanizomenon gracile PMC638.10]MDM3850110.1 DNA cytosine methyltransferase [Aphanizomenon gracile PMC627.10]MDM3857572.1 DNA cytosine methyltransferase [Aphanizomenon gracile PMC649.10]MDM3859889.1 DNA cytosine methyltransferase [Aphanizomenon gracile PMC644.10]MBE9247915.1 DNA cytosine methyltransferase [Dolichospermum sp. LEGE 00240]